MRTAWFRYAAIVLVIVASATFLYLHNQQSFKQTAQTKSPVKPDILPGGNKAVLTLSDGSTIVLDSAANGALAQQGNTKILKLDAGKLAYEGSTLGGELLYNTVSTPNGGQYQVTLPDGSNVWLNAASSITFPTAFSKDRRITITGEAYLEVAQAVTKPFYVSAGPTTIQVLGTSFNVNAYSNEPALTATLVEGRIKVLKGNQSQVLQPRQQAIVTEHIQLNSSVNTGASIAWKNGSFDLNDKSIETIMREIVRWYNVDIQYAGKIPVIPLEGKMGRDLNLSQCLKLLEKMNVQFRVSGRMITVLP